MRCITIEGFYLSDYERIDEDTDLYYKFLVPDEKIEEVKQRCSKWIIKEEDYNEESSCSA